MPTRASRVAMRSSNVGAAERIWVIRRLKLATQPVGLLPALYHVAMSFGESLDALAEDGTALVGFVIAAVLVLVLTPLVGRLAPRIGGLDDKADRPRVHKGAIPRIGGLAIVAGILIPTAILVDLDGPYLGILIGTLLRRRARAARRPHGRHARAASWSASTLIALIPVVGFDLTFDHVTLPRHRRPSTSAGPPIR